MSPSTKVNLVKKRAPEVTECIEIDKELHAKLFFKDCPVPLPHWLPSNKKKHACKITFQYTQGLSLINH